MLFKIIMFAIEIAFLFVITGMVSFIAYKTRQKQIGEMRRALVEARSFLVDLPKVLELPEVTATANIILTQKECTRIIRVINDAIRNDAGYRSLEREIRMRRILGELARSPGADPGLKKKAREALRE